MTDSSEPVTSAPHRGTGQAAALTAFLLLAAIIITLTLTTGPLVIRRYGQDLGIFLDGAWRVYQGQVQFTDFHSIMGPLIYMLFALGMRVVGLNIAAFPWTIVITFALVSALAWCVAWRRLHPVTAFAFSALTGLMVAGTYALGASTFNEDYLLGTGYAGIYNRIGFALFFILALDLFVLPRADARPGDALRCGLVSGGCLWLLFFLKISYFSMAVAACVLALLCIRRQARWYLGMLGGMLLVLLPMLVYLHGNVAGMVGDIRMVLHVRDLGMTCRDAAALLGDTWLEGLSLLAIALLLPRPPRQPGIAPAWLLAGIVVFLYFAGVGLTVTNFQFRQNPLLALIAVLLVEYALRQFPLAVPPLRLAPNILLPLMFAICGAQYLGIAGRDLASMPYAALLHRGYFVRQPLAPFQATPLAGIRLTRISGQMHTSFVDKVNDGAALLQPLLTPDSRLVVLDFCNPFSFLFRLPSPHDGPVHWHYHFTFNQRTAESPAHLFREATLVMVPQPYYEGIVGDRQVLMDLYGPYLQQHYAVRSTSAYWTVWQRKDLVTR